MEGDQVEQNAIVQVGVDIEQGSGIELFDEGFEFSQQGVLGARIGSR